MNSIFRYNNHNTVNWFHRFPLHSNQYCLYCGRFVGEGSNIESDKEHLIGRKFVPSGEFSDTGSFNFIFRACKECNREKAEIERHLSSVTLYNSPVVNDSKKYCTIAYQKASKDYHPDKKGVLVKDSHENLKISFCNDFLKMTFDLTGPPRENPDYVRLLAYRHIQGIFSLITSPNPLSVEGTKLLSPQYFHLYASSLFSVGRG